jgi:hypothetical protein
MAGAMLDTLIGDPEADDEEEAPVEMEDPKAKKRRAVKALFAAAKSNDVEAGVMALQDAVDACLEYGDAEE